MNNIPWLGIPTYIQFIMVPFNLFRFTGFGEQGRHVVPCFGERITFKGRRCFVCRSKSPHPSSEPGMYCYCPI